jgi:SAM-dependent methyltransferase
VSGVRLTVEEVLQAAESKAPPGPRLDVGAGWERRPGYIGLEVSALPGIDVVGRLGPGGLPFADGSFSVVLLNDVLEHVDAVEAIREVHRVTKVGGQVVISTVHFTSRDLYMDPTHQRGFSVRSLDFFVPGATATDRSYYFDFAFSEVETHLQFRSRMGNGRYLVWDRPVEHLVNRSAATQDLYELTLAARMFPAANVLATLTR